MAGGTEGFGAGGTRYSVTGATEHSAAGGAGAEIAENSVAVVFVHFGAAFLVDFVYFYPSPLPVFFFIFANGAMWSLCAILCSLSGVTITLGIAVSWDGASVFMAGADVGTGVGGIGQSFLVSNRFTEIDPA